MVDQVGLDLRGVLATGAQAVEHDSRVDGARSRGHHHAFERCEAHGGVHGATAVDGRNGCPGPEMRDDQAELARRPLQQGRDPPDGPLDRQPVESVAADAIVREPCARDRIAPRHFGQRRVERRVEAGDLAHRRCASDHRPDHGHRRRDVQRGQGADALDRGHGRVVDDERLDELGATVDHAVPDAEQVVRRWVAEGGEDPPDRVVGLRVAVPVDRDRGEGALLAAAEQARLERARPGVENEDPIARHAAVEPLSCISPLRGRRRRPC